MRLAYPRWSRALLAGLMLAGCQSTTNTEPVPAVEATAPASKPAAPAPVPSLAPVSDATLSYLEELPGKKCRWVQHTPPAEPRVLTVTASCPLSIAWKMDGKEALVVDKEGLWRVDLATGQRTPQTPPPEGKLATAGYDAQGQTVALTEEVSQEDPTHGRAHALRLQKDGTWKNFETKDTDFVDAGGSRVLDAFLEMPATTSNGWDAPYEAAQEVFEDDPGHKALDERQHPSVHGNWARIQTAAGPLYFWKTQEEGDEVRLGPVLLQGDKGLAVPEGLAVSGRMGVAVRGERVLLRSSSGSGKYVTQVWNAKTKQLVATLKSVRPVSFWPRFSPTPLRKMKSSEQLALAFRAVYGVSPSKKTPLKVTHEERVYAVSPTALEWMGNTAVFLTSAEDVAGCHPCSGAIGIHYLKLQGSGLAVKRSWPLQMKGGSFGAPPSDWKLRRDLGRNLYITTEGGFTGQGQTCASLLLTELTPERPISRGRVSTYYSNEGAITEDDKKTQWTGRIIQIVPDRSFNVTYTGSDHFTEHYQLQGEEYRRQAKSRFEDTCG